MIRGAIYRLEEDDDEVSIAAGCEGSIVPKGKPLRQRTQTRSRVLVVGRDAACQSFRPLVTSFCMEGRRVLCSKSVEISYLGSGILEVVFAMFLFYSIPYFRSLNLEERGNTVQNKNPGGPKEIQPYCLWPNCHSHHQR